MISSRFEASTLTCVEAVRQRRTGQAYAKYNLMLRMDLTLPLDYAAIERILPHRYPFLLVDRITEFEVDKRIVGIKNVSLNERYLSHRGERHRRCCRRRFSPKRSRRSARS